MWDVIWPRIFGVAINVPEPASHVFVQCGLEKSTVDLLVARTVYRTGGGQQRNAAATGVEQDGLPSRVDVGVIETKKLAGGRHEQRQAIEVGPSLDGLHRQQAFVRPASFTSMADVVDDECAFIHPPGNLLRGVVVPLSSGRARLEVGIRINLDHVVRVVIFANCVLL